MFFTILKSNDNNMFKTEQDLHLKICIKKNMFIRKIITADLAFNEFS